MKKIIFCTTKRFIIYVEIVLLFLLPPVLYNFVPLNKASTTFYLPASNIDDVTQLLEQKGYTVTWVDRYMIQLIQVPEEGWYSLERDVYGRFHFFATMYQKKAETMDVVVFAGETAEELTSRLANDMKLDQKKLLNLYHEQALFDDADIFADRYTVARNADENTTMSYLFDVTRETLEAYCYKHFDKRPETSDLKKLFTIASIIQKESNSVREMPLISSVIYNRLEKNMRLQMDSTLNYGPYSHTIVTSERIKTDTSHYNTYKHKGLPLAPLGTVTLDALYAAKYPIGSDYLFFMLSPEGGHKFASTYEAHLENIRAFRIHQKMKVAKKAQELKEASSLEAYVVINENAE